MADKLENQICPVCQKAFLTLIEDEQEVPYFGKVLIFSLKCSNCDFSSSDVECEEQKEPSRYTIVVDSEKDASIRVIKSSNATIKIPQLKLSVEPGPASIGYVSNIEGVLERFKEIGALKAVGWTRGNIVKMVLYESAFIGILGGLMGIICGYAASFAISLFGLTTVVSSSLIIGSFVGAVVIGIIGGMYQAFIASRMDPVEALRTE